MLKSKYFALSELVSPEILEVLSEDACWRLIPEEVIIGLDTLRVLHNHPIYINGKGLTQCGIRPLDCSTGAPLSGHKLYRGETCFDLHTSWLPELTQTVKGNFRQLGISRIENPLKTTAWLHVTFCKTNNQTLDVFDP